MSTLTFTLTDANRELALETWNQIDYAQAQNNGRSIWSANRKARRLLTKLLGDDHQAHLGLPYYYDILDRALWPVGA